MLQTKTTSLKAIILAAGYGTRLRPLTNISPKPLLSFMGTPLLSLTIKQLKSIPITQIIINAHYLWPKIKAFAESQPLSDNISVSVEKEQPLGTGGAYGAIKDWVAKSDLLSINGDIVSNINLQQLIHAHYSDEYIATLCLLPYAHPDETILWCKNNQVIDIGPRQPTTTGVSGHTFACAQVLSNRLVQRIPPGKTSSVVTFYKEALNKGEKIGACIQNPFWFDMGTLARYLKAHQDFLRLYSPQNDSIGIYNCANFLQNYNFFKKGQHIIDKIKITGPSVLPKNIPTDKPLAVGPYSFVEKGAFLAKGLSIEKSVVLKDTCIKKDLQNDLAHSFK